MTLFIFLANIALSVFFTELANDRFVFELPNTSTNQGWEFVCLLYQPISVQCFDYFLYLSFRFLRISNILWSMLDKDETTLRFLSAFTTFWKKNCFLFSSSFNFKIKKSKSILFKKSYWFVLLNRESKYWLL